MAKAAKSVVSGAAVFAAGLAIGILAMTGILLGLDSGLRDTKAYETRNGLVELHQSPRVAVARFGAGTRDTFFGFVNYPEQPDTNSVGNSSYRG